MGPDTCGILKAELCCRSWPNDSFTAVFPEATLTTSAEFEWWSQGVIRSFFDRITLFESFTAKSRATRLTWTLIVIWKASQWTPPAATSERTVMRADQSWIVRRSQPTGKAIITSYTVRGLVPATDEHE